MPTSESRADELRRRADHYRRLAIAFSDEMTQNALKDTAAELEQRAAAIEAMSSS
jgi:hypothetical protein